MELLDRRKGAATLYAQIEALLKEQIETGEVAKGDILPSEKQLMEHFQVSRMTVRQAMSNLSNLGYISCARGIGTIVTFEKINERIQHVISFSQELQQHGYEMKTSFARMEIVKASRTVAAALGIEPDETVYSLTRVRCAHDVPMVFSYTFLKRVREMPLHTEPYEHSLYQFLQNELDVRIAKAMDSFEATIAKREVAERLAIAEGSPVFKRKRVARDQTGEIVEYTVCYYPGDKYQYTVELKA